jgi:HK97 gp10 family phage protein
MADNVELKGLDNLENALKSLEKKMRTKEVFTMISKGAEVVKAEIKKNAPVMRGGSKKNKTKTRSAGLVRRSVSIRRSSIDRRQKNIGVFVNVKPAKKENRGSKSRLDPFYWSFVNQGWSPGNRQKTTSKKKRPRVVKQASYSIRGRKFIQSGAPKLSESLQIIERLFMIFIESKNRAS